MTYALLNDRRDGGSRPVSHEQVIQVFRSEVDGSKVGMTIDQEGSMPL